MLSYSDWQYSSNFSVKSELKIRKLTYSSQVLPIRCRIKSSLFREGWWIIVCCTSLIGFEMRKQTKCGLPLLFSWMCWCERRYSPFLFVQVAPADRWSSELAEGHLILANFAHFRGLRAHLNLLFVIVGLLVAVWAFIGFLSFNILVLLYVFVI